MNHIISVVIPVFNAENTLENAIHSVIKQTFGFDKIELILVDDNSSDNSKNIIKKYSDEYDNIKPIFLAENSGSPSKPRNVGIENATSQYIMFIDNDDEILPDFCEILYDVAIKEDCDVTYCNHTSKFLDGYYVYEDVSDDKLEYHEIEKSEILNLRFTVWANLFKTDFILKNDIRCPSTLYEDGLFGLKAYTKANKIINLPNYCGYIYTVEKEDDSSITHNIKKDRILSFIDGCNLCREYAESYNYDKNELYVNMTSMILFMFFKYNETKQEKINMLKEIKKFEISLNYPLKLKSKPLDILNKYLLDEKYSRVLLLSKIIGTLYNNQKIKNYIFKNYSGFKKIEY